MPASLAAPPHGWVKVFLSSPLPSHRRVILGVNQMLQLFGIKEGASQVAND